MIVLSTSRPLMDSGGFILEPRIMVGISWTADAIRSMPLKYESVASYYW